MTRIELSRIGKRFGATVALDAIDLVIDAGELFFLLGPSGCGKSTLLRLVAGLHEPTTGTIRFNGRDVTDLGTEKRNAVMCFQSYALWPHLSVADNVAFGLEVRGLSRMDRKKRVDEALALVQMTPYAARKPNQLSGGQQQRVALARAMAVRPDCLLLDEPLSNLDAKLRGEMRAEIRRICKSAGFTTIYVTHDQKEALSIADRIAVLRDGRIVQVGTPGELYHRPASSFVADFIGQTNLLKAKLVSHGDGAALFDTAIGRLEARCDGPPPAEALLSIRPEQMEIVDGSAMDDRPNRITGRVVESAFLGESSEHWIETGGTRLKVIVAPPRFGVDGELTVAFDAADVVILAE